MVLTLTGQKSWIVWTMESMTINHGCAWDSQIAHPLPLGENWAINKLINEWINNNNSNSNNQYPRDPYHLVKQMEVCSITTFAWIILIHARLHFSLHNFFWFISPFCHLRKWHKHLYIALESRLWLSITQLLNSEKSGFCDVTKPFQFQGLGWGAFLKTEVPPDAAGEGDDAM